MSIGATGGAGGPAELPPEYEAADGADCPAEEAAASEGAPEVDDGIPSPDGPPPAPAPFVFNPLRPGAIDLFPPGLGLPAYYEQGSFRVRTFGESAIASLADAAARNVTGPEARLRSYIQGEMRDALRSIQADEAAARNLPLGSPERKRLEDRIDVRERLFRNNVESATLRMAKEIAARSGGDKSALDRFKSALPPYLRECVERGGIVIPGVPGAFTPRTDDGVLRGPTGVDFEMPWG